MCFCWLLQLATVKKYLSSVFLVLQSLWIFLIPTNLFVKFGESQAYVHGLLSDYLLGKIYVVDLVGLALLICGGWLVSEKRAWQIDKKIKPTQLIWGSSIVFFLLSQILTVPFPASIWVISRLILTVALGYVLYYHRHLPKPIFLLWTMAISIFFQTTIAVYQFTNQSPVFGFLFLGETNLKRSVGIVTGVFQGAEKVLPYGTTAHPNILAGTVAIFVVLSFWLAAQMTMNRKRLFLLGSELICFSLLVWMTQSLAALFTVGLGLGLILTQRYTRLQLTSLTSIGLVGLVILTGPWLINKIGEFQPTNPSFSRRIHLNQAGWQLWQDHFWSGVGLNQVTRQIEAYGPTGEIVRFVQPIHHIGLLWLAETGLIGLVVALIALYYHRHSQLWILVLAISPILISDHFLLSLPPGNHVLLICCLVSGLLEVKNRLFKGKV